MFLEKKVLSSNFPLDFHEISALKEEKTMFSSSYIFHINLFLLFLKT